MLTGHLKGIIWPGETHIAKVLGCLFEVMGFAKGTQTGGGMPRTPWDLPITGQRVGMVPNFCNSIKEEGVCVPSGWIWRQSGCRESWMFRPCCSGKTPCLSIV